MDEVEAKLSSLKAEANAEEYGRDNHEVNKVANGTIVKPKKQSAVERFLKTKMKDTMINVLEPMAKDLMFNTLQDFASRVIYKNDNSYGAVGNSWRAGNNGYRDYGSYGGISRPRNTNSRGYSVNNGYGANGYSSDVPSRTGSIYDYRQFAVDDIREVNKVFEELNSTMFRYGNATVADVYRALGHEAQIINTDLNWGWRAEDYPRGLEAKYSWIQYGNPGEPKRTKYRLDLPEPQPLG